MPGSAMHFAARWSLVRGHKRRQFDGHLDQAQLPGQHGQRPALCSGADPGLRQGPIRSFQPDRDGLGATLAGIKPWAIASTGSQAQADMGITEVGRAINGASTVGNALGFWEVFPRPKPHGPGYGHGERKRMVLDNPNTYNVPLGNNNISGVNGHVALSMVFDASTRYQLFFVKIPTSQRFGTGAVPMEPGRNGSGFIRQTISWGP